jgi:hypothetical protein
VVSGQEQQGQPALLDKFTITRPDVAGKLVATLAGPFSSAGMLSYRIRVANHTSLGLCGVQVVFHAPSGLPLDGAADETTTVHGQDAVVTIGGLDPGADTVATLSFPAPSGVSAKTLKAVTATIRSSTVQPVIAKWAN